MIFFLFLNENICCGYSLEASRWGASNEYPQHMFSFRKERYQHFSDEKKSALSVAMDTALFQFMLGKNCMPYKEIIGALFRNGPKCQSWCKCCETKKDEKPDPYIAPAHEISCVKRKSSFKHVQNGQIQIILYKCKVFIWAFALNSYILCAWMHRLSGLWLYAQRGEDKFLHGVAQMVITTFFQEGTILQGHLLKFLNVFCKGFCIPVSTWKSIIYMFSIFWG